MLPVIAEYADVETMEILSAVHPLKFTYDISWNSLNANRDILERRRDYDEKLANAFEELIAVVRAEIEEARSTDSILESGFFLSARSSFRSELADAMSTLESVDVSPADSENSEEDWEDTHENPRSPTSPTTSPTSPTFRDRSRIPSAARERMQANHSSSPLRRQVSR